jgi:hypothetical protein
MDRRQRFETELTQKVHEKPIQLLIIIYNEDG